MKVNIPDVNNLVKAYSIKEVTNPIHFEKGQFPTTDGLFSFEIFGRTGSAERSQVFGYINLEEHFLHPEAYNALVRLNRKIDSCLTGSTNFKIVNGELVEDENGKCGLKFLYDNWEN